MIWRAIETPFGPLVAHWTGAGLLHSCGFTAAASPPAESGCLPKIIRERHHLLRQGIAEYFHDGCSIDWNLGWLDWSQISIFDRAVLRLCARIPAGEKMTYGQLAARAGNAKAARAVGGAMSRNRWPILIPCHRVVGANGKMTGYSGAGGIETKRRLLELESGELAVMS